MKKHDQFTEWLRDKILNNPEEPSADAWQHISESLDIEDAWENIGEDLDVDGVWQKVDHRLHRYENLQFYENISLGFSALALIPLFLFFFLLTGKEKRSENNRVVSEKELVLSEKAEAEELAGLSPEGLAKSADTGTENAKGDVEEKNSVFPPSNRFARDSQPSSKGVHSPYSPDQKAIISAALPEQGKTDLLPRDLKEKQEEDRLEPYAYHEIRLVNGLAYIIEEEFNPSIAIPQWNSVVLKPKETSISSVPKMVVGIGSAAKISWLLNSKTLDALQRESLTTAVPAVYSDLFLLYGFRLNDKTLLQADFYLVDWSGQKYKEYRNGTYGEVENKLLYRSLGISILKQGRQIGYGSNPVFPFYQAGLYGGWLQNAKEYAFTGTTDRTSEFSRLHMGIQLGYGYDWYVLENLAISYGIGARLDLLNVYSGTSAIPASFRRTRNASLDFKLSLKYIIGK